MRYLVVVACILAGACATPTTESVEQPATTATPHKDPPSTEQTRSTSTPASTRSSETQRATGRGTRIITADSDYGTMLFDASGQAIYLFTAEPAARPRCYDACAEDWPPVLTDGAPTTSGTARAGLLATTRRADGSAQLTYAGHPLYFYAHEGKYEVLCHNVTEYGGTWLVVQPDGTAAAG
jgi:predicted lipoprotein with Yx(FWY)xxD motif